jgi:hypothetical protein
MSTLIEQAIVDAKALRNAALKNAETSILEKYGKEVRVTMESLLESQESLDEDLEDEMKDEFDDEPLGFDSELSGEPGDDTELDVPFAAAEGEEMCACPDKDEEVPLEFSLEDLKAMSDELEGTPGMGEPESQEELFQEMVTLDDETMIPETDEDDTDSEEEARFEVDENLIRDLVEELVVDMKAEKSGWLGTPEPEIKHAEELELARLAATDAKEEMDDLKSAKEKLTLENESLVEDNEKLTETLYALKNKLEETILSNARLLYVNQTLNSTSLNERQKTKIVESIRKADSVEEAKVIFETLQSAAQTVSSRRAPKSLSEAISNKPSLTMPRTRNGLSEREDILKERFQRLAGIK